MSYLSGEGVPKNSKLTFKWLNESAKQGDEHAYRNLAELYERGEGTKRDLEEALRWYGRAALNSDRRAQLALGKLYLEGRGTQRDLVKAHMWFSSAAGDDGTRVHFNTGAVGVEARKFLNKISRRLSPSQIGEANLLLKACHEEESVDRSMTVCGLQ